MPSPRGSPHDARIFKKGDPAHPGDEVPRGFLQVLGGQTLPDGVGTGSGRLELAGWLTDPANPLTARVMVNRIWQHHFGKGLVATPNDFGARGKPPTHPELLDYLAARFVAGRLVDQGDAPPADAVADLPARRRRRLARRLGRPGQRPALAARAPPARRPRRSATPAGRRRRRWTARPGGAFPLPPESEFRYTQHVQFVAPGRSTPRAGPSTRSSSASAAGASWRSSTAPTRTSPRPTAR